MRSTRCPRFCLVVTVLLTSWALGRAGSAQPVRDLLPVEPTGRSGAAVYPAFEGWGPLRDGTIVLLLGYYNRNDVAVDVPIGPNNHIEPGGPDLGQPTHFEPKRQHGFFAIPVPKDLGTRKLTWTLRANGQTATVSFWMNPPYKIDFFKHAASGNEPPIVRVSQSGPGFSGPPQGFAQTLTGAVGRPVPLSLWVSDVPPERVGAEDELAVIRGRTRLVDPVAIVGSQTLGGAQPPRPSGPRPDVLVTWKKYRAPGGVAFSRNPIPIVTKGDPKVVAEAATSATFDTPGDYVLRAQVTDDSGEDGGGDQCCWTTALVKVTIK
jgi:hypothetical protein